ncbi:hypothetical protein [Nocardiopsis xinjiangensis]|uniref:hypothetical protein n=1 Tax=Nocardiopsis xinjiangensis TaxID=124285 RepID=UPI00034D3CE0|nr:hypothetical protein [Nocardiopsis xinjiangensis]
MRKAMAVTGAFALPLGLALASAPAHAQDRSEAGAGAGAGAGADDTRVLHAQLQPLNASSAGGTAMVEVKGTEVTVDIESTGLEPNVNAAQHFHIGEQDMCAPTPESDGNGTEMVARLEGDTFYEPATSLTTSGSTRPEDGLNLDSMPSANGKGEISYHRTFEVDEEVADQIKNEEAVLVQNSIDSSGAGVHESNSAEENEAPVEDRREAPGEATDETSAEASEKTTQPGTCGELVAAPENGMDTGFGGTAEAGNSDAGVVGLGTAGMVGVGAGLIVVAGAAAISGRLLWGTRA